MDSPSMAVQTPVVVVWQEVVEDGDAYLIGRIPELRSGPFSFFGLEFEVPTDEDRPLMCVSCLPSDLPSGEQEIGKVMFQVKCSDAATAKRLAEFVAVGIMRIFDEMQTKFAPKNESESPAKSPKVESESHE